MRFSNPGSAYGVLGSVLVLLFYLYVTGIVFLIGAELNALIGRKYDPATVEDLASRSDVEPDKRADARRQLLPRARTTRELPPHGVGRGAGFP